LNVSIALSEEIKSQTLMEASSETVTNKLGKEGRDLTLQTLDL
jgi:hypothetical protein